MGNWKTWTGSEWTDVVERISEEIYDFETGDTSRFDSVNDLSANTSRTYSGSYSGYCNSPQSNQPQAAVIPPNYDGGVKISEFEYYYQETINSSGAGIRLINSNGNVEVGTASDNPQWAIDDGNGTDGEVEKSQYDTWHRITLTFDWTAGTFSVDWDDLGGSYSYTDSGRPLKQGVDVEKIQLDEYHAGNWQPGSAIDMWYDEIRITP